MLHTWKYFSNILRADVNVMTCQKFDQELCSLCHQYYLPVMIMTEDSMKGKNSYIEVIPTVSGFNIVKIT